MDSLVSHFDEPKLSPELQSSSFFYRVAMFATISALVSQVQLPVNFLNHDFLGEPTLELDDFAEHSQSQAEPHTNEFEEPPETPPSPKIPSFWTFGCCGRSSKKKKPKQIKDPGKDVNSPLKAQPDPLPFISAVRRNLYSEGALSMVDEAHSGAIHGQRPVPIADGMAGVYAILGRNGETVGVLKPSNEEIGCESNPKGNVASSGTRPGVMPGQSMVREVAASLLDHDKFVGVPNTCLVECSSEIVSSPGGPTRASLQQFVQSEGSSGDFGATMFSVSDVQRIAMFDIRTLNLDRHDGNILVSRSSDNSFHLTPIDHAFCLPSRLQVSDFEWCWYDWPQTRQPTQPDIAEYIAKLNPDDDEKLLKQAGLNLGHNSLLVLKIMTVLLKEGTKRGLTLHEIASLAARTNEEELSSLEKLVARCKWDATAQSVGSVRFHVVGDFNKHVFARVSAVVPELVQSFLETKRAMSTTRAKRPRISV